MATKLTIIVSIIITFIVLLTAIAGMTGVLSASTNSIYNDCSSYTGVNGETLTDNGVNASCNNATDNNVVTYQSDMPLTSMFRTSGIAPLIVIAGILLALIGVAMYRWRK